MLWRRGVPSPFSACCGNSAQWGVSSCLDRATRMTQFRSLGVGWAPDEDSLRLASRADRLLPQRFPKTILVAPDMATSPATTNHRLTLSSGSHDQPIPTLGTMKLIKTLLCATLALALGLSALTVQETAATSTDATAEEAIIIAQQMPTYPLTSCVISDEEFSAESGEPISFLHEGRLVRVCCKSCVKKFKKSPEGSMAKIDQAIIAAQLPHYPLETCPTSGEELGGMGEPINVITGTRLVRFCCAGCIKGHKKDPSKAMAKLDAAYIAAQVENYPATTCLISGEELGGMGDPIDLLYGNTLVRLCCKGCVKGFWKDPAKHMTALRAQKKKAHGDADHGAHGEHGGEHGK